MIQIAKPMLARKELSMVRAVFESGMLAQGAHVAEFERRFAEYIGTKHAVAVGNGTQALHIIYAALGLKPGDEVIVPDLTFAATATPLLHLGLRPKIVDIEPKYYTIDPGRARYAIGKRTKAVVAVHLYGHPARLDQLCSLAEHFGLFLIEDACQAHGAQYKRKRGRKVGSIGACAAFSFYPTKNMTTGEGGMITTNSDELAYRCRLLRDHGQEPQYNHVILGHNFRMTEIAAAIGLVQLKKLNSMNAARRRNAALYNELLDGVVQTPAEARWARHVYHQYTIRVMKGRDALQAWLAHHQIATKVYYPRPLSKQPILREFRAGRNMETISTVRQILSIPVHPGLTTEDVEYVAKRIKEWKRR
ncbi:MAG: DegT/DnrJ/EryC1/StrS family aminotransferase [Candidatus Thermoplasmatota archaeon]